MPFIVLLLCSSHAVAQISYDWKDVSGHYLGQNPPGMTAEIFVLGLISTARSEINSVFSPEGDEFHSTAWTRSTDTKIMVTRQIEGSWTLPEVAPFSRNYSNVDPAFLYDGETIFFGTRRPHLGEAEIRERF